MTVREAAQRYIDSGMQPVPLHPASKKCIHDDWLTRAYSAADFDDSDNLGLRQANGLTDLDLDCPEAAFMAETFLPRTLAIYGRRSRPRSHWLYRCPDLTDAHAFKDLIEKKTLIEVRVKHQSMAPPSIHPDGEGVEWVSDDITAMVVEKPLLLRSTKLVATGAMICRYYNPAGARHDWGLAVAGFLRRLGIMEHEAVKLMTRAAEWARDDKVKDRLDAIRNTYAREDDAPTTGGNTLKELIGEQGKAFVATLFKIWDADHDTEARKGIFADRVDPATVDEVWEQLVKHNDPPTLFWRQRKIVMPIAEEITSNFDQLFARQLRLRLVQEVHEREGAQFAEVGVDLFTELLARSVKFVKAVGKGDHRRIVPAYPDQRLVKQIVASPVCPLPQARGITRTPSFDAQGRLLFTPGYHAESGIFYAPPPGFTLPTIPAKPTQEDIGHALALWHAMVCDFPFVDNAGYAHMLALPITVLGRELIKGPVPMCLVTKPVTGTGGTLLLQCVGWAVLGESLPESSWSSDEEEQRKYLTTLLMRGRPLINFDNITFLNSKDLLSVLSGDVREDRRLGGNELLTIPNRAVFVGSGNNVSYNEEHAGRLYVVRLDARVENPRLRDVSFKHPNLFEWVQAERPALVAGLLTTIQHWLAAGKPPYTGKRLAGFEAWSNVVGGILEHAQVPGFLENRDQVMHVAQRSQDEDIEFVTEWCNRRDASPPTLDGKHKTKDLLAALRDVVPAPKGGAIATTMTLGHYLEKNIDKVRTLDDGTVVAIRRGEDKHTSQPRWWLDVLHRQAGVQRKLDDDLPF